LLYLETSLLSPYFDLSASRHHHFKHLSYTAPVWLQDYQSGGDTTITTTITTTAEPEADSDEEPFIIRSLMQKQQPMQ
jgi:hypothetical protein